MTENESLRENVVSANATDSIYLRDGVALLDRKEFDQARDYLLLSSQSENIAIKAESFFYLNALEIELKNYPQALVYLEAYHKQAMALYDRAVKAEKEIRGHKVQIHQTIEDLDRKRNYTLGLGICFFIVMIILIMGVIWFFRRQKKSAHFDLTEKEHALNELDQMIESKKNSVKRINYNAYLVQADLFMKTPVYKEIIELAEQEKSKHMKVLNYHMQDALKIEIDKIFIDFIEDMKKQNNGLTENDIKLCCLSLLPLNTLAKALCFGSTEINIIKQRKHQIKKKMEKIPDQLALFEFIFAGRA